MENEIPDVPPEKEITNATSDEKMWAFMAHLSYLLTFVIGVSCIAPLIIWLIKKDESEFIEDQAKEALNFQLSVFLVSIVAVATVCLSPVVIVVIIGAVVYCVIGAGEANKGIRYRYPYTFRLIS